MPCPTFPPVRGKGGTYKYKGPKALLTERNPLCMTPPPCSARREEERHTHYKPSDVDGDDERRRILWLEVYSKIVYFSKPECSVIPHPQQEGAAATDWYGGGGRPTGEHNM
jgi:hypothetical protein